MRERLLHILLLLAVMAAAFAWGGRSAGADAGSQGEMSEIGRLLAQSDRVSGVERERLLHEAEESLRKEIARLEQAVETLRPSPAEQEDAIVEWFAARLQLADILGMRRGRTLIARMTLSVETAGQREELNLWMREARRELKEINADLVQRLRWAEGDPARRVNVAPRLEHLALNLRRQRAFVLYWHARTSPAGPERMRILDMARADIESLLSAALPESHRWRLQILEASCLLEMSRTQAALRLLTDLARAVPEGESEEDVLFLLALARIEHAAHVAAVGDEADTVREFALAAEAAARYQSLSPKENPIALIDVKALMLYERLDRYAGSVVDAGVRESIQSPLDNAIREFLYRHFSSSVREPAAELFLMNRDENLTSEAPAPVLALLAWQQLSQAKKRLAGRTADELTDAERASLEKELDEALRLAHLAKAQDGDRRRPIAPDALWTIGTAEKRLGALPDAAKAYEELSKDYRTHPLAKQAALQRMEICGRMLEEALAGGEEDAGKHRLELIDALEVLAGGWGESENADRWRMALAWQCAALAEEAESDSEFGEWTLRAVRSYSEVRCDGPFGLSARFLSLQQKYRLLRRIPPQNLEEAADTSGQLQALGAALKERAAAPQTPAEERDRLIGRAGLCELYALILRHSILGEDRALEMLAGMRERLGESAAVRGADRYLFAHALDGKRFAAASESVTRYREHYGDGEAVQLVESYLGRIHGLLQRGGADSVDGEVRLLYSQWAGWLYENAARDSLQYQTAARFHADALSREGGAAAAEKALEIYERLEAADLVRRESEQSGVVDVELAMGRARCLRTLNRPGEAVAILTPLCSGLPRGSVQFWTAQIERAECIVALGDPKALGQLPGLIRQLRQLDPELGRQDVKERFERLSSSVEN